MVKPKSFRPWNPKQTLLFPSSPVDWLPENHLVLFLLDLAAELDLEEIHAHYRQKDPRGEKANNTRMMVVLLLYAYCVGPPWPICREWVGLRGPLSTLPSIPADSHPRCHCVHVPV